MPISMPCNPSRVLGQANAGLSLLEISTRHFRSPGWCAKRWNPQYRNFLSSCQYCLKWALPFSILPITRRWGSTYIMRITVTVLFGRLTKLHFRRVYCELLLSVWDGVLHKYGCSTLLPTGRSNLFMLCDPSSLRQASKVVISLNPLILAASSTYFLWWLQDLIHHILDSPASHPCSLNARTELYKILSSNAVSDCVLDLVLWLFSLNFRRRREGTSVFRGKLASVFRRSFF